MYTDQIFFEFDQAHLIAFLLPFDALPGSNMISQAIFRRDDPGTSQIRLHH